MLATGFLVRTGIHFGNVEQGCLSGLWREPHIEQWANVQIRSTSILVAIEMLNVLKLE
jgi:hypothetical protein